MVVQQIGWDGESGASYDPDGLNYRCPCCDRQTRTMQALMQHMNARPQCRSGGVQHHAEPGAARVLKVAKRVKL